MPTLFNRIYAHTKLHNVPMISIEQRKELGSKMIKKYMATHEKPPKKAKAKQYDFEGGGMVLYYPVEFRQQMDKMIVAYYKKIAKKNTSLEPALPL